MRRAHAQTIHHALTVLTATNVSAGTVSVVTYVLPQLIHAKLIHRPIIHNVARMVFAFRKFRRALTSVNARQAMKAPTVTNLAQFANYFNHV